MKLKMLFCHFDLGHGGAEKVLVNLLKFIDYEKYEVTLYLLFKHGVNLPFVPSNVRVLYMFNRKPFIGITILLKLISPKLLHRLLIKDKYDIEIAYLEGAPTRIISGCPNQSTKLFSWVHTKAGKGFFRPYRSLREAHAAYSRFNKIIFVSEAAKLAFQSKTTWDHLTYSVCHNVMDINDILLKSNEHINFQLHSSSINMCSVGKLVENKGYPRLIRILGEIRKNVNLDWKLFILGEGSMRHVLENQILEYGLQDHVFLLGYDTNPYKYVAKMDVLLCASYNEGYSTAVVESLLVGTPVITTDCVGMSEILGDSGAGIIVENSYEGLRDIIEELLLGKLDVQSLKLNAVERARYFQKSNIIEFEDVISGN